MSHITPRSKVKVIIYYLSNYETIYVRVQKLIVDNGLMRVSLRSREYTKCRRKSLDRQIFTFTKDNTVNISLYHVYSTNGKSFIRRFQP